MYLARLAQLAAGAASRSSSCKQVLPTLSSALLGSPSTQAVTQAFHTSTSHWAATAPATTPEAVTRGDDKYGHLVDKDVWDEAWAYEPRFGTEDNPIQVPALLSERIIGVTDPDDDTLVIWGIVREGEPPKQLVAGGEFFVLKRVPHIAKVGDVLGIQLVPDGREAGGGGHH